MRVLTISLHLVTILLLTTQAQDKVVFTYFSMRHAELRAGYSEDNLESVFDLGFKNTFLPAWINSGVVFCGENFIWRTNTNGEELTKVGNGYKPSPSNSNKKFAYYAPGGIQVTNDDGSLFKLVEIDFWDDVSITWLKNDKGITFYNAEKQICYGFSFDEDSIFQIGDKVFQPVWNTLNNDFIYNAPVSESSFGIFLSSGLKAGGEDILLSDLQKNSLIPIWSKDAQSIYYIELLPDSLQDSPGTMLKGYLIELVLASREIYIIDSSAAYTDNVYPQFAVSERSGLLYYTHLDKTGFGKIASYNPAFKENKIYAGDNFRNDFRFPRVQ